MMWQHFSPHRSVRSTKPKRMLRQLLIAALVGLALSDPSKVDRNLRQTLRDQGTAAIVVSFRQSTQPVLDKINAMRFHTRGDKITAMKQQLEQLATSSQKDVIDLLKARSVNYESLWINNRIFVKNAGIKLAEDIADISDVIEVREEIVVHLDDPIIEEGAGIHGEWGIDMIQAEEAWALPGGNNGAGVVVSNIDTGVRFTHEALKKNWRADYGWYDPYVRLPEPVDENGHGTHTMGTIAGSGGIGVAPGAQWIACRGCDTSSCHEVALTTCGQWSVCPYLPDGSGDDCTKAPTISSNSWGGGQGEDWFNSVVEAWHTAGIIPVFSIGNSGPACGTAGSPGDMTNVIGVGASSPIDGIASFSSRGPAKNGAIKPDISAPGQNVRSAWNTGDTAYNTISGTSMAAPHLSGSIALLQAFNNNLSYAQIKGLLEENAHRTDLMPATACGGIPYNEFPNHVYGHGRLNIRNALAAAINGRH